MNKAVVKNCALCCLFPLLHRGCFHRPTDPPALQTGTVNHILSGNNGIELCPACSNQISRKLQGRKLKRICGKPAVVVLEIGLQYANKYVFSIFSRGFFFPETCGELYDEHGQRFHRDISATEKKYQEKLSSALLGDCCRTVNRDPPGLM
jgi:hypothetical protein